MNNMEKPPEEQKEGKETPSAKNHRADEEIEQAVDKINEEIDKQRQAGIPEEEISASAKTDIQWIEKKDEENNKEEQLPGFHAWEEKQYQKEETEQAMETMLRESGFYNPKDEPETKLPEFDAWEKEQYQKEETENTLEDIRNAIEGKRDKILFENNFYNLPEKEQEKTMNNLGKESNNICSWIENLKESLDGASPEEQEKINKKIEFLKTKRGDVLFELQAYHLALGKDVQKEGINLITKKIEKIKEGEEKEKNHQKQYLN